MQSDLNVSVPAGDGATIIVDCPAGQVATGGGGGFTSPNSGLVVEDTQPSLSGSSQVGWEMQVINTSGSAEPFNTYVICMPTSAQSGAAQPSTAAQPAATVHLHSL